MLWFRVGREHFKLAVVRRERIWLRCLPIVVNGRTALHTLTQSYYVTRLVEAVKTLPPMENYEFIATKAFKDFNNVLDEAGSEKREQLLPGKN